jgi:hypothetical protein
VGSLFQKEELVRLEMKKVFLIVITLFLTYPCLAEDYFYLGDREGEAELLSPRQVKEGPDGNIYVYDRLTAFIKVFSPEGRFLRKMGGKGQGPGEIQRIDGVSFGFTYDKKRLFFTEFFGGHRWITFMELTGKFHNVLKLKMKRNYAISRAISLKDGGFLAKASFPCDSKRKKDYFLYRCPSAIVKISPGGEIVSEILRTGHVERISMLSSGADLPIPFVPLFKWARLKDGSIVFSEGLSSVLKVYDSRGKITGQIKTPLPEPQRVTPEDLEKWKKSYENRIRDKGWFRRFGKVLDKYKESIHNKKPNIRAITLTPGNNLLIGSRLNALIEGNQFWLIDLSGRTLKKIKINGYDLRISEHFIFIKSKDEDDNPLVFCMKRKGKEAEDLDRLEKYQVRF